ncbi:hypothetical protein Godav_013405 [Gossypium davidsonii]|uniref:Uncharacterized protein n=1 Tax=Gossypium davidsonii TaxID=34287 RepID=A0A7J8RHM0_GOSDV|nr:hypothetical protein [Gossypium davidsonii]
MGAIPVIIFTSSSKLPLYIPSRNKFEMTSYEDPAIQECILEEFFVNPNIWHVKIPLVVYIIMEMHESNRGRMDMNWLIFHAQYINMWNIMYNFLPTRKVIVVPELAYGLETDETGPSSATKQESTPTATPPIAPSSMYYTSMPSIFSTTTMYRSSMFQALTESPLVMPLMYGTQHSYTHLLFVTQTPPGSLFYQGESSFQPPIPRPEDTRWQLRMHRL